MIDLTRADVQFAVEAVTAAASACREIQRQLGQGTLRKSDRSPVTVADFTSQALIAHRLQQAFPKDVLVAEEDSAQLRQPGSEPVLREVARWFGRFAEGLEPDQVCQLVDYGGQPPARRV